MCHGLFPHIRKRYVKNSKTYFTYGIIYFIIKAYQIQRKSITNIYSDFCVITCVKSKRAAIRRISIGTFYEPWVLGEADSRSSCLPLPLFGYFLGFFCESADDADVAVVDNDFLLRRPGVSFCSLTDLNLLDKEVQKLSV